MHSTFHPADQGKRATIVVLLLLLGACDSGELWRDPPYAVYWIDTPDNVELVRDIESTSASIGRVQARVIAVGGDDQFVVAKRVDPQTGEISYFYIDRSLDGTYLNQDEITEGPFSEQQYRLLKAELRLPDFSHSF